MKTVKAEDAIGKVIAHDMTQIIVGEFKGARFKKGHVVTEEDIPVLLSIGKRYVNVVDKDDTDVHEDEAARRIAEAASGRGITMTAPSEGKVELRAEYTGILKINKDILFELVCQDEIMFSTIHGNHVVQKGDVLGGTRIIPLFIAEELLQVAEKTLSTGTLIEVVPMLPKKVGIVTTGSEVYSGIIEDAFGPVLKDKFEKLGSEIMEQVIVGDDENMIADAIKTLIDKGAEIISVTGGMSVDPDDRTPSGIRLAGGEVVSYGAPVLPGAMFMLSYIGDIPVTGLPGCVMYSNASIFDLVVPRLLAGERITKKDIIMMAHGGFCLKCKNCTYPKCSFGKA